MSPSHARVSRCQGLSPDLVRQELDRILASPIFKRSARLTAFLRYVVEQSLSGRADTLKEPVLALELYNRNGDFDPSQDPIVRVDARRLRDKLREYYSEWPDRPITISLPKGSYVPAIEARSIEVDVEIVGANHAFVDGNSRVAKTSFRRWHLLAAAVLAAFGAMPLLLLLSKYRTPPQSASGEVRPLASLPGTKGWPSLSPNGKEVAFSWSGPPEKPNPGIYIKTIDGDGLRRLTSGEGPAWSPDGQRIAFWRKGSERGVFIIPLNGGKERRITGSGSEVAWFPNSQELTFQDDDPDSPDRFAIFAVSVATLKRRQLTHAPTGSGDWRSVVSPDGKTLAFIRYVVPHQADIYVMPLPEGKPRRLTTWNSGFLGLDWTPDGREIVYSVREIADARLWRIAANAAPGKGTRLPEPTGSAHNPSISRGVPGRPTRLAFRAAPPELTLRLIDLRRDPGGTLDAGRILHHSTRQESEGRVSPQGDRLVFVSDREGRGEIWLSAMDGSGLRRLTYLNAVGTSLPAWSPDGRHIAFQSRVAGANARSVFVLDVDKRSPQRITDPMNLGPPHWSTDGRWIYFMSDRSGFYRIWKIRPTGKDLTPVTQRGGFEAEESPDGKYLYYSEHPPRGTSTLNGPMRLMRLSLTDGREVVMPPQIWAMHWGVTDQGILYLSMPKSVMLYRFSDGKTVLIGNLPDDLQNIPGVVTFSHDGRWLALSKQEGRMSDLMLIDHFQ